MEYRIKNIQKNSGQNLFIPQYREDDYVASLALKIIFSPIMFIFWICFGNPKWIHIPEYFDTWTNMGSTTYFLLNYGEKICESKEVAEQIIITHKHKLEEQLKKDQEKKNKIQMNKTKKIVYIKY